MYSIRMERLFCLCLCLFVVYCSSQSTKSSEFKVPEVDYTDMGTYQHGMQMNSERSEETNESCKKEFKRGNQGEQTSCTRRDDRAAKFYKRLVGSLLTQMRVRSTRLNEGEMLSLNLKVDLSSKDLESLQKFLMTEPSKLQDLEQDDLYRKVDSILTSFLQVASAPVYVEFTEFLSLQLRKWRSAETFNLLVSIFFILALMKMLSFLANARTVTEIIKLVLGFVIVLTMFVVILQSQGYVLWQSLPTETVGRMFSSMWFQYLNDWIDSVSHNISKEFILPSLFQPFVKILVWLVFLVYWIFILLLFSVVLVLLFTVKEIFSKRIRTWFGVIEPVQQQPSVARVEVQEEIRPRLRETSQMQLALRRRKKETKDVGTQVCMMSDSEDEFVEVSGDHVSEVED